MTRNEGHTSVLLDNVCKLIQKKVHAPNVSLVEIFAKTLYSNMSKEDLASRNDSDLYGAALSLWNSLEGHTSDDVLIRVFNPELAKNGWHSSHTIVEIIAKDMPFLVDSVRMALIRENIASHLLLHCPLKIQRDEEQKISGLSSLKEESNSSSTQTVFFIEIDRQTDKKAIESITQELQSVLLDVSVAVEDWHAIKDKLVEVTSDIPNRKGKDNAAEINETVEFLDWLARDNFTLMGYRQYDLSPIQGDYQLKGVAGSSLGLMKNSLEDKIRLMSDMPEIARKEAHSDNLLILTKTNSISRVHRPAYIDYIGIKRFDKKGNVIGEDRFIGLFSSNFYNNSAADVPVLKSKINRIMDMSDFAKGTHAYKAVLNILETYPRDELLQAKEAELLDVAMGVLQVQERDMCRIFVRKDMYGRFLSCMVYVPRERYNTALRRETQQILASAFNTSQKVEFTTFFSESILARTHYTVRLDDNNIEYNVKDIERNLIEAARTWEDKLQSALLELAGESRGKELNRKYANAFSSSYKEQVLPSAAVVDIEKLESLSDDNKLEMLFYRPQEESDKSMVRLSLFHKDVPIHLSDVMPMLENFGLRVIGETPYAVKTTDGQVNWVMDFSMLLTKDVSDFDKSSVRFQKALTNVWHNRLESDGFNRLVLASGLTGRESSILRAYAKYMRQIGVTFSQSYIESTFEHYPNIAIQLVKLFNKKFSPKAKFSEKAVDKLTNEIYAELDNVSNLDDDRIIRSYIDLITATIRTNYYQLDALGNNKSYISFKVKPNLIPDMPLPLPAFEIFVYSPRVEGVHLRGGKVARGGLRWSDRREDFRTEVLGLVKAQQVKNTVIVPVGSKGGFVCKQAPSPSDRDAFFKEGQECYKIFIRGLLDITDNIDRGEIVPPVDVVRHDEDDPYLVVAADKGTATFSDIANGISEEYGFWLGDAFASGGSVGYDHKKMGITAKGGWESVKRHFREMGIDCQTTDFTCVAVGDMAGDVFGNGMLLSKHTRLQVAFNHMHIFIDPTPDAASSYKERQRLFDLPRSSWEDYDASLISQGGGIFNRSAKSITLTPEIKKMLGTKKVAMAPNELIKAVLMMPVDLIWNGGIGTYVKAKHETDVGDRANDSLRVNGSELNAKIFGEGGNLGCTQLGRIEFAAKGGRINTDFIDNVGGVACSDNEVNIKILLNGLVAQGDMTKKQRDELLYSMTDEVSRLVLRDCYRQTHTISVTQLKGASTLKEQIRFIHALEKEGKLDRAIEFLPTDEELAERLAAGKGLTRPELSVLVSYAKMVLKEWLVTPEITDNPYYRQLLVNAFPVPLREKFNAAMDNHPLRSEIIATKLANNIINDMGLNFVIRMMEETGAPASEVVICYSMASAVFEMSKTWSEIEELDNKIPAIVQTEMLYQLRRTVRRATRWFLRHRNKAFTIEHKLEFYGPAFADLNKNLTSYMVEEESVKLSSEAKALEQEGVPAELAKRIAQLSSLFSVMDLAQVAKQSNRSISVTADTYFKLGARMGLHWFLDQITLQPVANHWQALARASYREELDWQQRSLAAVVMNSCDKEVCDVDGIIDTWMQENEVLLSRWQMMLAEFKTTKVHDFAKFSVALRELMLLSHNCDTSK